MLLGVLSDIHADLHALIDGLDRLEKLGCDEIVCAGDLVSYGAFSEKTVQLMKQRKVPCVRGNHDHWAGSSGRDLTGQELSVPAQRYLRDLPANLERTVSGVRIAVWHARPGDDMAGIHADADPADLRRVLDEAHADVLIVGHVHSPMSIELEGRLIVNAGALLRDTPQPIDVGMFGTVGVLELPERRWGVVRAADGVELEFDRRRC